MEYSAQWPQPADQEDIGSGCRLYTRAEKQATAEMEPRCSSAVPILFSRNVKSRNAEYHHTSFIAKGIDNANKGKWCLVFWLWCS